MSERIEGESGSLAQSMLAPLYAQARCAEKFGELFCDPGAQRVMQGVGDRFKKPRLKDMDMLPDAIRRRIFTDWIADYLAHNPDAQVVDLGAGYDTFFDTVDNGTCSWVNIDHEAVLDARKQLMGTRERQTDLAYSIFDPDWFDLVKDAPGGRTLFIASDVLGHYQPDAVKLLVCSLADEFPGAAMIFDTVSKSNLGRANKAARKSGNSGTQFALDEVGSVRTWSKSIIDAQDISVVPADIMASKAISLPVRLMLFSGGAAGAMKVARLQFARR